MTVSSGTMIQRGVYYVKNGYGVAKMSDYDEFSPLLSNILSTKLISPKGEGSKTHYAMPVVQKKHLDGHIPFCNLMDHPWKIVSRTLLGLFTLNLFSYCCVFSFLKKKIQKDKIEILILNMSYFQRSQFQKLLQC